MQFSFAKGIPHKLCIYKLILREALPKINPIQFQLFSFFPWVQLHLCEPACQNAVAHISACAGTSSYCAGSCGSV